MEKDQHLSSDCEEGDVDIIGDLEDSNTADDNRISNNGNSSISTPEDQNLSIIDDDHKKENEDESFDVDVIGRISNNGHFGIVNSEDKNCTIINDDVQKESGDDEFSEVDVIGEGSLPKIQTGTTKNSFHSQEGNALRLDHLDPQPGPSGINNETNHILHIDSDSDDSIKIIEIPKKPVPVIMVSDSSDDEEIDVVQVIPKKILKAKATAQINPPKTIKEKLEEQREKLFPVKTEENETGQSPPNNHDSMCSICLGHCENRAFLDQCFHSFCYTCIIQWANIVHTCPLCKTSFKSIIYDVQPDLQYKQNFMKEPTRTNAAELPDLIAFESLFHPGQRFRYRTTVTTSMSNQMNDLNRQARYESSRNRRPSRSRWGRQSSSSHQLNASEERRRSIYRLGMIIKEIKHPPGRVRFRDTSLRFFKDNPAIAHRLVPWILRDLKVILDNNGNDASFVLHLIMSLLVRYPLESNEFHTELQPFLLNDTRQFIRELISFASSPYDMRTYDSRVVYDMPSALQAANSRNNSTMTSSTLQRPSNIQLEREISFQERLVDELFAGSRLEVSPPLTRGSQSPDRDDILAHTGWNTDDSEIEITRVVPVMQEDNRSTPTMSSTNDRNDIATSRNQRNDIAFVGKPKDNILIDCENVQAASSKKLLRKRVSKDNNRHSYFTSGSSSSDEESSRPSSKSRRTDTSKQKKGKSKKRRRSRSHSYSRRRSTRSISRSNPDESFRYKTSVRANDFSEPGHKESRGRSSSKTSHHSKGSKRLERSQEALLDKERSNLSRPRSRSRENHNSRSRSRHGPKSRPRTRSRSPSLDLLARRGRERTSPHRSRFNVEERILGRHERRSSSNSSSTKGVKMGTELCYSPGSSSGFSRHRGNKRRSRSPGTKIDRRKDDKGKTFDSPNVNTSHAKASETLEREISGTPQEESFLEKMMKDAEQNESSSSSGKVGAYSTNHVVPSNKRSHEFKEQSQFDLLCDAFESDDRTQKRGSRSASKSSSSDYVKKHKHKKRKKEKKAGKEKKTRKKNPSDVDSDSEILSGKEVLSGGNPRSESKDVTEVVGPIVCPAVGAIDCESERQSRSVYELEDHSSIERCDSTFTNKEENVKIGSDDSSIEIEESRTRSKKKSKKQHKHKKHKNKRGRKGQHVGNVINLTENGQYESDQEITKDFGHKPSEGAASESRCQTVILDVEISDSNRKSRGKALNEDKGQNDTTAEDTGLNQSKNARLESKHNTDILNSETSDSERTGRGDETRKDGRPVEIMADDLGLPQSNGESVGFQNETDVASIKMADSKRSRNPFYITDGSRKQQTLGDGFSTSCMAVVVEDHKKKMIRPKMKESLANSDTRVRKSSGSNLSPEYNRKSFFSVLGSEEQNLKGNVNGWISSNESKSHGLKDGFGLDESRNDITANWGNATEKSFEIIQKDVKESNALTNGALRIASSDEIDQTVNSLLSVGNIRQLAEWKDLSALGKLNSSKRNQSGILEDGERRLKPTGETIIEQHDIDSPSENCKSAIDERLFAKSSRKEGIHSLSVEEDPELHQSEIATKQKCLSLSEQQDSGVNTSSNGTVSELHNASSEPFSFNLVANGLSDESFGIHSGRTDTNLREHHLLTAGNSSPSLGFSEQSTTPSNLRDREEEKDSLSTRDTNSQRTKTNLGEHLLSNAASSSPLSTVANCLTDKQLDKNIISKRSSLLGMKESFEGSANCLLINASSPQMLSLGEESVISNSSGNNEQREININEGYSGNRKLVLEDPSCQLRANQGHFHMNHLPKAEISVCLISPTVPVMKEATKIYDYEAKIASQLSEHNCTAGAVKENEQEATGNERNHNGTVGRRKVRIVSKRQTDL